MGRRLFYAYHGGNFGQQVGQHSEQAQLFDSLAGGVADQELPQLIAQTFWAGQDDGARHAQDLFAGLFIHGQVEIERDAHRAYHADGIFGQAGRADPAQDAAFQVANAAAHVDQGCRASPFQGKGQRVDGEVAAAQIHGDFAPAQPRHVAHQRLAGRAEDQARHIARFIQGIIGPAQAIRHAPRQRVGRMGHGHIEVNHAVIAPQEMVSHRAAHHIGRADLLRDGCQQGLKGWVFRFPVHGWEG